MKWTVMLVCVCAIAGAVTCSGYMYSLQRAATIRSQTQCTQNVAQFTNTRVTVYINKKI